MATYNYQQATFAGLTPTLTAAAGGGDALVGPNDHGAFMVKNGGGSPITVTLVVPGNTKYGLPNPDPTIAVAAGATALIGPLPADLADPTTGLVNFTYSGVTSVTVGGVSL